MCGLTLRQRYTAAVTEAFDGPSEESGLLPLALVRACVAVLPVAGAGVSVTETVRVPLSASNAFVALAERLQTTLGEGPCLAATASDVPMVADLTTMAMRWPVYHDQLVAQTPFRSVASIPLRSADTPRFGALDLYSTNPDVTIFAEMLPLAVEVATSVAAALLATPATRNSIGVRVPAWMNSDLVTNRANVWVAIGIIISHANLTDTDAVAVLRAYAFTHDLSLDEVARGMVSEKISAEDVLT